MSSSSSFALIIIVAADHDIASLFPVYFLASYNTSITHLFNLFLISNLFCAYDSSKLNHPHRLIELPKLTLRFTQI